MNAKKIRSFLLSAACWFWITVVVAVLAIFWEPLFSGLYIWGPDSSSFGFIQQRYSLPASYLGWWDNLHGLGAGSSGQPMVPYHVVGFVVPPLFIQAGIYIGAMLGSILAAIYWFRGYGVKGWPAYLAALALGLTAHTFSLIAAGHGGKIEAMPFAILLLAAVYRALTRRSLFHFALAGYAAGVAFSVQQDFALLFTLLASIYGLCLFCRLWPRRLNAALPTMDDSLDRRESAGQRLLKLRIQHVLRSILGALLAAVILVGVSLTALISVLTVALPHRQALASASGTTGDAEKNKWEFATNWSLPPEEMLEFVTAGVFGWQSGDDVLPFQNVNRLRVPYWGRTGRTVGWEQHHQGLMNLRQNGHYLGLLQWVFAVYAIAWALRRRCPASAKASVGRQVPGVRCQKMAEGGMVSGGRKQEAEDSEKIRNPKSEIRNRRADIFFWAGVLLVSVLLALGRNFPLYRLFYMLPFISTLRGPVKFLHVAEVALCLLFAFGLDRFFSELAAKCRTASDAREQPPRKTGKKRKQQEGATGGLPAPPVGPWRSFAVACGLIGLLMILAAAVTPAYERSLLETWRMVGLGNHSGALLKGMVWALARTGLLFLAVAVLFLMARYIAKSALACQFISLALLAILSVDLVYVDKRYVNVWDEYERFTPSELISRLGSDKTNYRVALPVRGGLYDVWRNYDFPKHWITILDSENFDALSAEDKLFYEKLSRAPLRLWQITSTPNIIGPTAFLAPLTNAASVEAATFFNFTREGAVQWTSPGQGQQVWLRLRNVLPRAAVYPAEYMEGNSWTNRLADPTWNPAQTVIVTGSSAGRHGGLGQGRCEPAEIVSYKPNRVEISARSGSGGILMLNDRFDPEWEVFLDGKAAPLLRCNGVMRGVEVPAGEHTVLFIYRPQLMLFCLNAVASLVVLVLGVIRLSACPRRSQLAEHAT